MLTFLVLVAFAGAAFAYLWGWARGWDAANAAQAPERAVLLRLTEGLREERDLARRQLKEWRD